jgi:ABC-type transporter Mla maintaining outer membrane lipid asymmetry ATPase subunit MlaF
VADDPDHLMTGDDGRANFSQDACVPPEIPAIELIDVYADYAETRVLRGVSFAARAGQITVLLGPSGVGKTTTLRHVLGLLTPIEGDVLVEGRSTLAMRKSKRLALSRRFGVLLQGDGLYGSALWDSMTVEQNLLHQLRAQRDWDEDALHRRCQERLREVGLADNAKQMPAGLSAGMRRRVALARAMVADPDFVVLDSFELGVDPVRLSGLCELIKRRHDAVGATYLVATQSMDVARRLADEVVVLWEGRVIEQGPAGAVLASLQPEVRQLVTGSTEGPLGMAGDTRTNRHRPPAARPPTEHDFEVPVPLVALALLMILTASALVLGHAHLVELVLVAVLWLLGAAGLLVRQRRSR